MAGSLLRGGRRNEEDDWGKEILNALREIWQEVKQERKELKQEMEQIKRQLERLEKAQVTGGQRKGCEGRAEAEKSVVGKGERDAEVEEKIREDEIERVEKTEKGRCEKNRLKLGKGSSTGKGWYYKGRSIDGPEETISEEEANSEKSWNSDRREGKGKGSEAHEITMERGSEINTEKEKERCESESEDGSESEAKRRGRRIDWKTYSIRGRDIERDGEGAEGEKKNVWKMVKRREERMRSERDRSVKERACREDRAERERAAKRRRSLVWSGLKGTGPAERKEFMEIVAEMALDRKVRVKGVVEIKERERRK